MQNAGNILGRNNAPPGPSNVMKMEHVNRSNSSSRLVNQGSRIEYINIGGDSAKDLNLIQRPVNAQISPQSSPYFVVNPQISRPVLTNVNTMVPRPPSNVSAQSS